MKKTILYRLFGVGAIPEKLLTVLKQEDLVFFDEGIGGRFITKNVKGPGRRYIHRSEGFSGFLAVTKKRVLCYTYGKPQINIPFNNPKISNLYVNAITEELLSVSFESSVFRDGWEGVMEFRFKTEKAVQFHHFLLSVGAKQGTAPDSELSTKHSRALGT